MTRYVLDARAAIELAREDLVIPTEHELLAPTLIRSQVLSLLHEAVHAGAMTEQEAQRRRARIDGWRMRLLGDAVLRRVAWQLADRLGWTSTFDAEYVALTRLQADALITADPDLAAAVRDLVRVAPIAELRRPG
ncbi:MAG TPA: type II toxin-antitoxin system VapC family toxin [Nakamurella sp.]|nr:type II toxin-antitoxin system VapC family toxin [Nakamurella sp.]